MIEEPATEPYSEELELQADELDERFTNDVEVDARVGDFVQFQWGN